MEDFEPSRTTYKDDNYQRAQEIVSMLPMAAIQQREQKPVYHYSKRPPFRSNFNPTERAAILNRVSVVGVEKAAQEAGTSSKIIMRWLRGIDESMSHKPTAKAKLNIAKAHHQQTLIKPEVKQPDVVEPPKIKVEEVKNSEPVKELKPETTENKTNRYSEDFTEEEKNAVIERAKKVGYTKAAREFNTTRWVILNWIDSSVKKRKTFTTEEIEKIVARSYEVGMRQAARETGATRQRIKNWRNEIQLRLATQGSNNNIEEVEDVKVKKVKAKKSKPTQAKTRIKPEPMPEPEIIYEEPAEEDNNTYEDVSEYYYDEDFEESESESVVEVDPRSVEIEIENAILRQKIADMTAHINKLKGVVVNLV